MSHLEIIELVLIHWNNVSNDYEWDPRILYKFVPKNHLVNYLIFHPKNLYS